MPSVEVQYKDAGALRFLKLLSGYFGFKVVENQPGSDNTEPEKDKEQGMRKAALIPGNDRKNYEAFLTSKNLDAETLRRDLWKRS